MNEMVIIHTGVKGMKWGIRRYQNEDGTLTDLGKAHYKKATGNIAYNINSVRTAKKIKKAHMEKMSDQDIQRKLGRLNLENAYARAISEKEGYSLKSAKTNRMFNVILPLAITSASAIALSTKGKALLDAKGIDIKDLAYKAATSSSRKLITI